MYCVIIAAVEHRGHTRNPPFFPQATQVCQPLFQSHKQISGMAIVSGMSGFSGVSATPETGQKLTIGSPV